MHNQPIETAHPISSFSTFPRGLSWLTASLFLVLLLCGMDTPGSPAQSSGLLGAKVKRGETVFQQHCIGCHNKQPGDTTPFGPPNLNGIFRGPSAITTKQAEEVVVQGKGTMPGWGTVLVHSDIEDVVAYLKTR